MSRAAGFGLLQALIVLTVLGALVFGASRLVADDSKAAAHHAYVQSEARDLAILARALDDWSEANTATVSAWYDQQPHSVTFATLIDAGALPSDFAYRFGAMGTSPFMQPYQFLAWGRMVEGAPGPLLWVVYESGSTSPSVLTKIGVAPTAAGIAALKREIALAVSSEYDAHGGVIDANSTTAVGAGDTWSVDILDDFTSGFSTLSEARAVVLVNYTELGGIVEDDPPSGPKWKEVILLNASTAQSWIDTCEEYGKEPIVAFPECNAPPGDAMAFASDLGPVTMRKHVMHTTRAYKDGWLRAPDGAFPEGTVRFVDYTSRTTTWDIYLNGAYIGTNKHSSLSLGCGMHGWWQSRMKGDTAAGGHAFCFDGYNGSGKPFLDPTEWCVQPSTTGSENPRGMNYLCGIPVP